MFDCDVLSGSFTEQRKSANDRLITPRSLSVAEAISINSFQTTPKKCGLRVDLVTFRYSIYLSGMVI